MFAGADEDEVPITSRTACTYCRRSSPSRSGCSTTATSAKAGSGAWENPRTWEPVSSIPDEELWHASASPESG